MTRGGALVAILLMAAGCAVSQSPNAMADVATPRFLLIVRERIRPGREQAYDENELQLAEVCARLKCPHPYLALTTTRGPKEVWWLNAFASSQERDGLDAAYKSNQPLMDAMTPLGKRKEDFRESFTSAMTESRRDESDAPLQIAGARFLVVRSGQNGGSAKGAVFEGNDRARLAIASVGNEATAEHIAAGFGRDAIILAVQPQWSFPDRSWIDADPEFWRENPVARGARR